MKINDKYELKKVLDNYVLVDNTTNSNQIIKINEMSKVILDYLNDGLTKEQIIETLLKEYDASEVQIRNDVNNFINDLISKGIING